jgi:hypothetical protein
VTASISSGGGGTASLIGSATVATDGSGLATFNGLGISGLVGSYTLAFSSTGLGGTASSSFGLAAGAPTQLAVLTEPAGATSGAAFGTAPAVLLRDGAGNRVNQAGVSVTASIASGGGGSATLVGTTTVATDGSGVATFNGLGISGLAGPYTIGFASGGLTGTTSASFNLSAGAPTQLDMVTQPSGAVSGQAFTTQPAVRLLDGVGNPVSQAGVNVTASITGGGGGAALNGTTTVATDGSGVATFSGLGITGTAGSYSLDFTAGGLTGTTSASFNVTVNPTQLGMVTEPAGAVSGMALTTQPVVQLLDAGSSPVAQAGVSVTASITGGGGGATLIGTVTVATDAAGQATFSNLGVNGLVGSYSLDFTAAGLTGVTSASFNVTAGAPTQLEMVTQPSGAVSGQAFTTQPVVRLRDGAGNPVSQAGVNVAVAITGGGGGATLNGTTTVATDASGVATFSGLGITGSAGSYSLDFTAGGLTGTTSASINLTVNATQLGMVAEPAGAASGAAFATQPVVQLLDAGSNAVPQAGVNVTASITGGGGGATLIGTVTVATDAAGLATFSNLGLSGPVGSYSLDFAAGGLNGVTSGSFNLTAGAPTQLQVVTDPSGAVNGVAFGTQPAVRLEDSGGNPVNQAGVTVTAGITGGGATLLGTNSASTDGSGLATFADLGITGTATSYSLTFTAAGLADAVSGGFALAVGAPFALDLVTSPAGAVSGAPFGTQPVVRLLDSGGNQVAQAGIDVTASILSGDPGTTLDGTATVATDGTGVAAFGDLGLTGAVGPYEIVFSSTGLASVSSPIGLAFSVQPGVGEPAVANVTHDSLTMLSEAHPAVGNMTPDTGVTVRMAIAPQVSHAESSASVIEGGHVGDGPGPVCRDGAAHEPDCRDAPWT